MMQLLERIKNIEKALASETNQYKRWCQRKELRKVLRQMESMQA